MDNENAKSSSKTTAELILEYARVFIWPLVILFALVIFKSQMENILENRKIKIGGLLEIGERIQEIEKQATIEIQDVKKLTAELKRVQEDGSNENVAAISSKITDKLEALDSNLTKSVSMLRKDTTSLERGVVQQQSIQQIPLFNETINKEGAKALEAEGFKYVIDRNLSEAIRAFSEADRLWPGYHNAAKIQNYLKHYETELEAASKADKVKLWDQLYETLLLKYSWGMPAGIREQLQQ
ncbi:MAG: hypothetical protein V3U78_10835 [Thiotrichaceae bacterium]